MKFLGVSDEITTCEHCGKQDLKRTIAIETEDGSIVHYGCDCAARALKQSSANVNTRDMNQLADVLAYGQKWLAVYDAQTIASAIWKKYGFLSEVRNGAVVFKTTGGLVELRK